MRLGAAALTCAALSLIGARGEAGAPQPAVPGPRTSPVVATRSGAVAGALTDADGGEIAAFKGIPYAAPPVGSRRWRPPEPAARWSGVRDARHFSDDCEQVPYVIPTGQNPSEDCLTVNVWTAARELHGHRPVMVFVYGGGFIGGSAAYPLYDGAKLAAHGVVVVSFNYRVGIFGFLAHPKLSAESPAQTSGNYGLLDQIAALYWVKRNIAAFGGDAARVTVFGESAGAVSIALLLTSPLAQGLFDQAIMQSPTVPPLATLADAERSGAALDPDIGALRRRPAAALLPHNGDFFPHTNHTLIVPAVPMPVVDGYVLPAQPRSALAAGTARAVPTIVGVSADEGRMFAMPQTAAAYRAWVEDRFGLLAQQILRLYPATSDAAASAERSAVLGDAMFDESARLIARGVAQHQPRTFAYVFTRGVAGRPQTATHSEILPFVFGTLDRPSFIRHAPPDATDRHLSETIMQAWARFAATGDPNGPGMPRWPAYSPVDDPYLELGMQVRTGVAYHRAQLDAFEPFYATGQP